MSELERHLREASLTGPDFNTAARRSLLNAHLWQLVDHEPAWATADDERLALLCERIGDVAGAYLRGHTDIEGEIQKVAATALAWLDALGQERAR